MLGLIFLIGCQDHQILADKYDLELDYFEYSYKFLAQNMTVQAVEACSRLEWLRSECYLTLVQDLMSKEETVLKEYCDEIIPEYQVPMTTGAFKIVYGRLDKEMKKETKEMRKPTEIRQERIMQIKDECYNNAE